MSSEAVHLDRRPAGAAVGAVLAPRVHRGEAGAGWPTARQVPGGGRVVGGGLVDEVGGGPPATVSTRTSSNDALA